MLGLAFAALAAQAASLPDMPIAADGRSIVFHAYEGDKKVGAHQIRFSRGQDGALVVDVAATLEGRVLFVPFTYSHRNQERWRDNQLVSLASRTRTNDRIDWVAGERKAGTFAWTSSNGENSLAGPVWSTTWWKPEAVQASTLLNTQKGTLEEVVIKDRARTPAGNRQIELGGRLRVTLEYDARDCLVGLEFKRPVDGKRITYELVAQPDARKAPELAAFPRVSRCMVNQTQTAQSRIGAAGQ